MGFVRALGGRSADNGIRVVEKAVAIIGFSGFLVVQQAAWRIVPRGHGAILLTGATASVKGFARSPAFAKGKFALRSRARTQGNPRRAFRHRRRGGRHPDPPDNPDSTLDRDAIAQTYVDVLRQHRSAWSLDVEVGPVGRAILGAIAGRQAKCCEDAASG
jgi:hypothetical protein